MVEEIRSVPQWKNMGTVKLYKRLKPAITKLGIKMGRAALNELLREHKLLVRRRHRRVITTNSNHMFNKYDNLIRGVEPGKAGLIWVSDITYIETTTDFVYLFLITDLYSRKIVGYNLSVNLKAESAIKALQMAFEQRKPLAAWESLIHHSDRGIQYCCPEYVSVLNNNDIVISMAAKGNPYENAVAERINGILKNEMAMDRVFKDHCEAAEQTRITIDMYNNERTHQSINDLTPAEAHLMTGKIPKKW
jgi:putative transposase